MKQGLKFYIMKVHDEGDGFVEKHIIGYKMPKDQIQDKNEEFFKAPVTMKEITKKKAQSIKTRWYVDNSGLSVNFGLMVQRLESEITQGKLGNINKFKKFFKD